MFPPPTHTSASPFFDCRAHFEAFFFKKHKGKWKFLDVIICTTVTLYIQTHKHTCKSIRVTKRVRERKRDKRKKIVVGNFKWICSKFSQTWTHSDTQTDKHRTQKHHWSANKTRCEWIFNSSFEDWIWSLIFSLRDSNSTKRNGRFLRKIPESKLRMKNLFRPISYPIDRHFLNFSTYNFHLRNFLDFHKLLRHLITSNSHKELKDFSGIFPCASANRTFLSSAQMMQFVKFWRRKNRARGNFMRTWNPQNSVLL